jgi:hypothetical protein
MVETLNCLQFRREKGAFLHMRNSAATRCNSLQLRRNSTNFAANYASIKSRVPGEPPSQYCNFRLLFPLYETINPGLLVHRCPLHSY